MPGMTAAIAAADVAARAQIGGQRDEARPSRADPGRPGDLPPAARDERAPRLPRTRPRSTGRDRPAQGHARDGSDHRRRGAPAARPRMPIERAASRSAAPT